jgi:ferritin
MISEKMEAALNQQMQREFYSASLYLSMSAWCSDNDLNGFANWFRIQAMEEMTHAMKFYDFIFERDGRAVVPALDEPPRDFKSFENAFQEALGHERKVSAWINELVDLALEEKDHATNSFLQWFVSEQVEEEDTAKSILQQIKLVGEAGQGLFMLDRELGQRVFTPPTTAE